MPSTLKKMRRLTFVGCSVFCLMNRPFVKLLLTGELWEGLGANQTWDNEPAISRNSHWISKFSNYHVKFFWSQIPEQKHQKRKKSSRFLLLLFCVCVCVCLQMEEGSPSTHQSLGHWNFFLTPNTADICAEKGTLPRLFRCIQKW